MIIENGRAHRRADALGFYQIFVSDGQAVQRANLFTAGNSRISRFGPGQGAVGIKSHNRIDNGVDAVNLG